MTLEEYQDEKYKILQTIRCKEAKIRFFQNRAVDTSVRYSETSGCSGSRNAHSMEDAVVNTEELREQIRAEREQLKQLDESFLRELREMDDPKLAMVLELKYIHGGSWRDIADSMQYSVRQLHRLQKEAAEYLRAKSTDGS